MRLVTGVCRSSYMYCRELTLPKKRKDSDADPKVKTCRTQILIPKKDKKTVRLIEAAVEAAARKKFGSDINIQSRKFKHPLRDGDEELKEGEIEGDHYRKHYFLNATGYKLPGVVNQYNERVEDPDDLDEIVVSGYKFRFSITARGFDVDSRGVRFILNNLMFMKEDERLDGSMDAEDEFEEYGEEDNRDDDD